MKTLEEQMSFYLRDHRDPRQRLAHYVGAALILFALFDLLGLAHVQIGDMSFTPASAIAVGLIAYYFRLDAVLGGAMLLVTAVLLIAANRVCALGTLPALTVFAVAFGGGCLLQMIGHGLRGGRAFGDALARTVIAPFLLLAEVFFAFGYKRDVAERVEQFAVQTERGR